MTKHKSNNISDKDANIYQLYDFLANHQVSNEDDPSTHSIVYHNSNSPVGQRGYFNVPKRLYGHLVKYYTNALKAGARLHIIEKAQAFGPMVIKLVFNESFENSNRMYTKQTIKDVITGYCRTAKKCLRVRSNKLDSYVMETSEPVLYGGQYYDSVLVIFPKAVCTVESQMLIRKEFIEYAKENGISGYGVIDSDIIKYGTWPMYGSTTCDAYEPSIVTSIYQFADGNIHDTYLPMKDDIDYFVKINSILSCETSDILRVRDIYKQSALEACIDKQQEEFGIGNDMDMTFDETRYSYNDKVLDEPMYEQAKYLISMLSNKRATSYHSWIQVGMCLHNLDQRLYTDWIEFSKKTTKDNFSEKVCKKVWDNMEENHFSMASLHFFAKCDSREMYDEYIKSRSSSKLYEAVTKCTEALVWEYLNEKYPYRFACADVDHKIWFEFTRHRWIRLNGASSLFALIAGDIKKDVIELIKVLNHKKMVNEGNKDYFELMIKKAETLRKKLEGATFIGLVIRYGSNLAYNDRFMELLDSNVNLICFTNGVYDLEADIFRDGCPDDMISLHTRYAYIPYNPRDKIYAEIHDFFRKIIPDPEVRQYLLTALAISISGSIEEQKFYILTGSGSNGKTRLMMLMSDVLGELYKTMNVSVLVGKSAEQGKASPDIADKKGIRFCPINEPGPEDKLNSGTMKTFSGDEPIAPRQLYEKNVYFIPQFTGFLICNDTPEVETDDGGTWRRMVVIDFVTKFINKNDLDNKNIPECELGPNRYYVDKTLKARMAKWKQPMMAYLIHLYRNYRENGYTTPKAIIERNLRYRRECDKYQDFIYDFLTKTSDESKYVSLDTIAAGFRNWWRANGFSGNHPSKKIIRNYFRHKIEGYNPITNRLHGYILREMELDD